jgi:hypothetical protein
MPSSSSLRRLDRINCRAPSGAGTQTTKRLFSSMPTSSRAEHLSATSREMFSSFWPNVTASVTLGTPSASLFCGATFGGTAILRTPFRGRRGHPYVERSSMWGCPQPDIPPQRGISDWGFERGDSRVTCHNRSTPRFRARLGTGLASHFKVTKRFDSVLASARVGFGEVAK